MDYRARIEAGLGYAEAGKPSDVGSKEYWDWFFDKVVGRKTKQDFGGGLRNWDLPNGHVLSIRISDDGLWSWGVYFEDEERQALASMGRYEYFWRALQDWFDSDYFKEHFQKENNAKGGKINGNAG